jgi:hypothetical protein
MVIKKLESFCQDIANMRTGANIKRVLSEGHTPVKNVPWIQLGFLRNHHTYMTTSIRASNCPRSLIILTLCHGEYNVQTPITHYNSEQQFSTKSSIVQRIASLMHT